MKRRLKENKHELTLKYIVCFVSYILLVSSLVFNLETVDIKLPLCLLHQQPLRSL